MIQYLRSELTVANFILNFLLKFWWIQYKNEDQEFGPVLYLTSSLMWLVVEEWMIEYAYFVPSIWSIGPDKFSMNKALNRVSHGL